jgi:tetratricopeptide (TPR) repeat protein
VATALIAAAIPSLSSAAAGNSGQAAGPPKAEETNSLELMRTYLQLQEQLHQAQLSIEETRKEARETAAKTTEALTAQLQTIEAALGSQRARELEAMQSSNRVMLVMAGSFAGIGLIAMVLMAIFQWRTIHGLAGISAVLPNMRVLGPGSGPPALGPGEPQAVSAIGGESTVRLLTALDQLEQRIHGLERGGRPALNAGEPKPDAKGNGAGGHGPQSSEAIAAQAAEQPLSKSQVRDLLSKGQLLLDQDDPTAALLHFEQALSLSPGDPEGFVKKGAALERLGRLGEALECYDMAITADDSLTIAYLHKGGLCNRLEKFTEALECYEKALRTQEAQST